MRSTRIERVNELLRAELSELVARSVKDPRVGGLVSVTEVTTTADLHHARAYISVFGDAAERASTLAALKSAAGFLRREMARRVVLRHTPDFEFVLDNSIERGDNLLRLIREANAPPEPPPRRARRKPSRE